MKTFHLPHLNKKATGVFLKLLSKLPDGTTERAIKLDNAPGVYMYLCFEFSHPINFGPYPAKVYSMAHYYKSHGDLVPDPDMVFLHFEFEGQPVVIPMAFQNAMRYDEVLFFDPELQKWQQRKAGIKSLVDFAQTWLKNIEYQQEL